MMLKSSVKKHSTSTKKSMAVSIKKLKNSDTENRLPTDDYSNLSELYRKLEALLKINIMNVSSLQLILELLEKIKLCSKTYKSESDGEIKKFRIHKSLKKENKEACLSIKSLIILNGSQKQCELIDSKQELNLINYDIENPQVEIIGTSSKSNLKKQRGYHQTSFAKSQLMIESEQETITKLKSKINMLSLSHEEKVKEVSSLENKIRIMIQKEETLNQRICELEKNLESVEVQLKVSLKCIENANLVENRASCVEKINEELKFLIMAQSNEIESIKSKLIETQRTYASYSTFSW